MGVEADPSAVSSNLSLGEQGESVCVGVEGEGANEGGEGAAENREVDHRARQGKDSWGSC